MKTYNDREDESYRNEYEDPNKEELIYTEQDYYQGVLYIEELLNKDSPSTFAGSQYHASARLVLGVLKENWQKKWEEID